MGIHSRARKLFYSFLLVLKVALGVSVIVVSLRLLCAPFTSSTRRINIIYLFELILDRFFHKYLKNCMFKIKCSRIKLHV